MLFIIIILLVLIIVRYNVVIDLIAIDKYIVNDYL